MRGILTVQLVEGRCVDREILRPHPIAGKERLEELAVRGDGGVHGPGQIVPLTVQIFSHLVCRRKTFEKVGERKGRGGLIERDEDKRVEGWREREMERVRLTSN